MYQPGMDRQLAQVYYNEMLHDAANERADRQARGATSKPAVRRLALALAASAPIAVLIVWMLVAH